MGLAALLSGFIVFYHNVSESSLANFLLRDTHFPAFDSMLDASSCIDRSIDQSIFFFPFVVAGSESVPLA
jgi:hypothetical protein